MINTVDKPPLILHKKHIYQRKVICAIHRFPNLVNFDCEMHRVIN